MILKTIKRPEECSVVHCNAGNDRNGNPRRIFLVFHNGALVGSIDEEYEGEQALDIFGEETGRILRSRIALVLAITPSEYRRLLNLT
jgi:hypothetical protein